MKKAGTKAGFPSGLLNCILLAYVERNVGIFPFERYFSVADGVGEFFGQRG